MIMTFLKLCVNVMNRNIKIQSIFGIVKISKSIQPNLYMCFLYFSKVWWVLKNEDVMFIMVPPNFTYTLKYIKIKAHLDISIMGVCILRWLIFWKNKKLQKSILQC